MSMVLKLPASHSLVVVLMKIKVPGMEFFNGMVFILNFTIMNAVRKRDTECRSLFMTQEAEFS